MTETKAQAAKARRKFWTRQQYLRLSLLAFAVLISMGIFLLRDQLFDLEVYKNYGYIGVFVVSLLSTGSLIFPIPGVVVVFALGGVLDPLLLSLVAGLGMALGETTGYLAGVGGRGFFENRRLYLRIEDWMRRWGGVTVFVMAFVPNPLFDVGGAAAGALRFPLWKFLLFCFLGRTLRCLGIAYAGAWSMPWLIDLWRSLGGG